MEIRRATPDEAPALVALVARAYGGYVTRLGRLPGPMLDDYPARCRGGAAWAALQAGTLVGLLILLDQDGGLLIDNIAVDPAKQGLGLGRALLGFAQEEAARRGHDEMRLYTHERMTENIALYAKLGWEETGRVEQHGFRRVLFRKRLRIQQD